MSTKEDTDKAVRSIITQWQGGERKLAGARASELVYGGGSKPNGKLLDKITSGAPGIMDFIVPPADSPVEDVRQHRGNHPEAVTASNQSSAKAKDEQDVIDDVLAPGRAQRGDAGELGSTKLNPAGSDQDPKGAAANPRNAKTSK